MGSVQHHQAQARRFLSLARSDLNSADCHRAANALARAASHAATAAVVHSAHFRRCTRRRLTNYLFIMAAEGRVSNGGVKTFRQIYRLPRRLAAASPDAARRLCRQARNRVSALIRSVEGAIAGRPVTGRGRRPPRPPSRPMPRSMTEIMALPDYREIAEAYGLAGSAGPTPRPPRFLRPRPHSPSLLLPSRRPFPARRPRLHRSVSPVEARPRTNLPRQIPRYHPRPLVNRPHAYPLSTAVIARMPSGIRGNLVGVLTAVHNKPLLR